MEERTKTCESCGRRFEWRRKWQECWEEVKYCSERCRRSKGGDTGLESVILELLSERNSKGTICPSDAARRYYGESAWREKMEETRCAARRLVAAGRVVILQKGKVVDPSTAKGPIRIKQSRR